MVRNTYGKQKEKTIIMGTVSSLEEIPSIPKILDTLKEKREIHRNLIPCDT